MPYGYEFTDSADAKFVLKILANTAVQVAMSLAARWSV